MLADFKKPFMKKSEEEDLQKYAAYLPTQKETSAFLRKLMGYFHCSICYHLESQPEETKICILL